MSILNLFGKKKSPQELMAAGNYKAALKAVDEILAKSKKKDPTLLLVKADINLKMGNRSEARKGYIAVGEYYGDAGFFNKAVAVFKKALNITPNDKEILEKLSSYNNKVPKYILDSTFLRKASGESQPKKADPEAVTLDEPVAVEEPATVDAPTPVVPAADADTQVSAVQAVPPVPEFDTADHELEAPPEFDTADHEPIVAASEAHTPEAAVQTMDEDGDDDIDFDTLSDISEALSAEFGKPFEPLPKTAARPPLPEPAPAPAAGNLSEGMPIGGGIVFSTRPSEVAKKTEGLEMDFSSLDDALDSLFAAEPSAPKEENSRHWALFRSMSEEAFMALVVALEGRDYEPGMNIVEQGGIGDTMFLIADGGVDILIEKDGVVLKVASLGEGDFFGEASLLTGQPRNATVQATSPTSCLLLNKTQLDELTRSHPTIMESIQTIYNARARQNAGK